MPSELEPLTVHRSTYTLQSSVQGHFTFPIIFQHKDRNRELDVGRVCRNTGQRMTTVENVGRELDRLSPHRINEHLLIASLSFHVIIPVAAPRQHLQYQRH